MDTKWQLKTCHYMFLDYALWTKTLNFPDFRSTNTFWLFPPCLGTAGWDTCSCLLCCSWAGCVHCGVAVAAVAAAAEEWGRAAARSWPAGWGLRPCSGWPRTAVGCCRTTTIGCPTETRRWVESVIIFWNVSNIIADDVALRTCWCFAI